MFNLYLCPTFFITYTLVSFIKHNAMILLVCLFEFVERLAIPRSKSGIPVSIFVIITKTRPCNKDFFQL